MWMVNVIIMQDIMNKLHDYILQNYLIIPYKTNKYNTLSSFNYDIKSTITKNNKIYTYSYKIDIYFYNNSNMIEIRYILNGPYQKSYHKFKTFYNIFDLINYMDEIIIDFFNNFGNKNA